jgi:hypothetical protein|tara:strand:+ start:354 stop:461 length:108 start_codon:yes stop_codon:yes gene_type:complete
MGRFTQSYLRIAMSIIVQLSMASSMRPTTDALVAP